MDVDGTPELYTVWARDVAFKLTRTQLQHDSPNYFTSAFLEHDFQEAHTRVIYTDRNPQIFGLIVEYLSGYDILPLGDNLGGGGEEAKAVFRRNLLKDADFFDLEKLAEALNAPPPPPTLPEILRETCGFHKVAGAGPIEVVEWDTFISTNAQGIALDALVVLRDVKLRFQQSTRDGEGTVLTVRMDSDIPQSAALDPEHALPRHCVQDIPRDHNILTINGDAVHRNAYYAADAGFTQDELLQDRAININGIISSQSDLFDHIAFRSNIPTYTADHRETAWPFATVRFKMDVLDDLQGQLLQQTILHAHEVFFVLVDLGEPADADSLPGPRKILEMIYARCSTQEHLSMEMGRQILSKFQRSL